MIHTSYDLNGALESAFKAAKRTQRVRYVVRQATGLIIESKRPCAVFYEGFKVAPNGTIWRLRKCYAK